MTPRNRYVPLPPEFAETIRSEFSFDDVAGNGLIRATRDAGWTLRSMAEVCGVTREAIRLRTLKVTEHDAANQASMYDIPPVPPAPVTPPRPIPRRFWPVPAAIAAELRTLTDTARSINGGTLADDPRREATVELSKRLAALMEEGYGFTPLAKAMGVSRAAVRMRLMRHGYLTPFPSIIGQDYRGHAVFERKP